MLNAAKALTEDTSCPYRQSIKIIIHICTQHFARSLNVFDGLKDQEGLIFDTVMRMSRSSDQESFFAYLRETCIKLAVMKSSEEYRSVAMLGIKLISIHPRHWTIFANTHSFVEDKYAAERNLVIDQLLTWKQIIIPENQSLSMDEFSDYQSSSDIPDREFFKKCSYNVIK